MLIAIEMVASTRDGRLEQLPLSGSGRLAVVFDDPSRMLKRQWSGNGAARCGVQQASTVWIATRWLGPFLGRSARFARPEAFAHLGLQIIVETSAY